MSHVTSPYSEGTLRRRTARKGKALKLRPDLIVALGMLELAVLPLIAIVVAVLIGVLIDTLVHHGI